VAPIVTLLTDFGVESTYPAQMKGVILGRCPEARIVDLSHGVPRHDVRTAAFMLASAVKAFPEGTVHVAVVDPGVGSSRPILAAAVEGSLFIAPDNGLLTIILGTEHEGRAGRRVEALVSVENASLFRAEVSSTFHGRDVFAPVAAELASGTPIGDLGPPVKEFRPFEVPAPKCEGGRVLGEVLYVDPFGNLVTNIPAGALRSGSQDRTQTRIAGAVINGLSAAYSDVHAGMLLAYIGSAGFLEVAVNRQSAADRLGAGIGTRVSVKVGD